ncbi:hypothetical protein FACS1894152_0460 [Bacilli bacterium]|nr:hypothetical protein FACS1894152_0340 [Bacilli bacterium]GHU26249.1 hypothetical protein FACS1894152_0460 [Bacilli bacterium]
MKLKLVTMEMKKLLHLHHLLHHRLLHSHYSMKMVRNMGIERMEMMKMMTLILHIHHHRLLFHHLLHLHHLHLHYSMKRMGGVDKMEV